MHLLNLLRHISTLILKHPIDIRTFLFECHVHLITFVLDRRVDLPAGFMQQPFILHTLIAMHM